MQLLRYLLLPFTPVYYIWTWIRNKLYDIGLKPSKSYNLPIICVGNLSTGGTGKSPMIEYLIKLLKSNYKIATLSRGYGRKTKGFVLADDNSNAIKLGDEPFQFYLKYGNTITVSVSENRQEGIAKLLAIKIAPEIILLDDAYQHRKVSAGLNILLTTYNQIYTEDWVLPLGNLREPRSGAIRAQLIVVTKCPINISEREKETIKNNIKLSATQKIFFSSISYSKKVIGSNKEIVLESLPKFTLVTGIANAKPLVHFLKSKGLEFNHIEYKDHYHFTIKDIAKFHEEELIITTEKDYMRLKVFNSLENKLFYIPIEVLIHDKYQFDSIIREFVI